MSFVGKAIRGVGKAIGSVLGLTPDTPTPLPAPVAPTLSAASVAANTDVAAQQQAAAMAGGRTSTILSGSAGFEEDPDKTSKVLLGK